MIFDQIQSGMGGKENSNLKLGGKSSLIGSASMIDNHIKQLDGKIIGCIYCGDNFFKENEDIVKSKIVAMINKMSPDVVICGPAYNYEGYARMCAILGDEIQKNTSVNVVSAMSKENSDIIDFYKDKIDIVVMPKKGGTGLSEALKNICVLAKKKFDKSSDLEDFKNSICY